MSVRIVDYNDRNPALLKFPKKNHTAGIAVIIIGVLVMLFPLIVDFGAVAPVVGVEIGGFMGVLSGTAVVADEEIRHRKRQKALAGRACKGVITEVKHMRKRIHRGSRDIMVDFYCADCEFTDPETNENRVCTSHYVAYNLKGYEGREVMVYIDSADSSNCCVDLTVLEQESL